MRLVRWQLSLLCLSYFPLAPIFLFPLCFHSLFLRFLFDTWEADLIFFNGFLDFDAVNAVVDATHRYAEIFYDKGR